MISALSVAAGYTALVVAFGWLGVAMIAVHLFIMALAGWRPK